MRVGDAPVHDPADRVLGKGDATDAVHRRLHDDPAGAGVADIGAGVAAVVDPGEHQIGQAVVEDVLHADHEGIQRRPGNGRAPLAQLHHPQRGPQGNAA